MDPALIGIGVTITIAAGAFALYIIRGEIAKAGKDRQPRNGGTGWIDVHHKLDTVILRQTDVIADVTYLRARLDQHIDHHDGN
jgi:hypothetical protein